MSKISNLTHYLAIGAAAFWAFMLSPAGQAIQAQYPKVAAAVAGITTVLALYKQPQSAGTTVTK
jgi:hypothetical protein